MKTILFQGDSITDAGRIRENPASLGWGYPQFVAGRLGLEKPGAFRVLNRGVSGDRVVDIYARMKRDILNLKPDVLSVLVGVNDVWHELEIENGVDAQKFQKIYGMLLEEIKQALPDTKIILMEPFVAPGSATKANMAYFSREVALRGQAVEQLAAEFDLPLIRLQQDLDTMGRDLPEDWWLIDGVHPTAAFHQYLADRWLDTFRNFGL